MTADRSPFSAWPWPIIAVAALVAIAIVAWRPASQAPAPAAVTASVDLDAAARRLGSTPIGKALELRFPGALRESAEAEAVGGAPAARAVAARLRRIALLTAPDALLEQHASLMRMALDTVLDLDPSPCVALLEGSLDTAALMSPEWAQADENFTVLLFSAPPRRDKPLRPGAAWRALQPVMLSLTPAQQGLLDAPATSRASCEAWLAWFDAAARLSGRERRLALRAMMQR